MIHVRRANVFLDSSMVERPAVNRNVPGSNPGRGAFARRATHCGWPFVFSAESGRESSDTGGGEETWEHACILIGL